jgi:hypothetical protein
MLPQVVPQIPQHVAAWLEGMAMLPIGWLVPPGRTIPPSCPVFIHFNLIAINSTTTTIQQIAVTPGRHVS